MKGAAAKGATALLLALGLAGGCGTNPNTLDGSIGESFALGFDRVRIRKQSNTLLIEYLNGVASGFEKPCKIVLDIEDLTLGDDAVVDGEAFLQRVTIDRITATGGPFPDLERGSVEFREVALDAGGRVDGEFEAIFVNGRTISGKFDGNVELVSLE
mgnify:CR=1 FL=1